MKKMPQNARPRRFRSSQRVALFLRSQGYCSACGVPLASGWHADHIRPYSKGGETDSLNGQALCGTCDQKKGNKIGE